MRRVGVLQFVPALEPVVEGFRRGLEELGLREGTDVEYAYCSVDGQAELLPTALKALLKQGVELIMACGTPAAKAAAQASRPVVFAPVFDPIGAGLVERGDHPGRPITGVSGMFLGERKLSLLNELFPGLKSVTIIYNPDDPNSPVEAAALEAAGRRRGVTLRRAEVKDASELAASLPGLLEEAEVALLSLDRLTEAELERIAAAAVQARRPLVAHNAAGVRRGALLALEADPVQLGRRAASLAFRIFNGADPASIPVDYAEAARLVFNPQVAEVIGYRLPASVRPDEVVAGGSGA